MQLLITQGRSISDWTTWMAHYWQRINISLRDINPGTMLKYLNNLTYNLKSWDYCTMLQWLNNKLKGFKRYCGLVQSVLFIFCPVTQQARERSCDCVCHSVREPSCFICTRETTIVSLPPKHWINCMVVWNDIIWNKKIKKVGVVKE